MFNSCEFGRILLRIVAVAVLASGIVWAQDSAGTAPQDVFAGWNASLTTAAERALAASLSDRQWMKSPGPPKVPSEQEPVLRVRAAVNRVQQMRRVLDPILRQEGVPPELSAVVLVESGGQLTALSSKGARGPWQFMPETARRYGLAVTAGTDERIEIEKSTHAAARYLRDLHQRFGDWQVVLAAYNAGEQTVEQAMARLGERDFPAIQRALPQETRAYVPAVFAAIAALGGKHGAALGTVRRGDRRRVLYASSQAED